MNSLAVVGVRVASVLSLVLPAGAGLQAGDPVEWGGAPSAPPAGEQPKFPQFGRRAADTNLPSYTVGTLSYRHDFSADFDNLPGDLAIDDLALWSPLPPVIWGENALISFVGYRATWLDAGSQSIIPDDDLHAFRLPIAYLRDAPENWIWGAMVMPSFSSDLSGSSDDAWSIAAAAGVGYAYSPTLRIFAGAFYSHAVNDDDFFIPGVAFTWRPHPDWEAFLLPPIAGVSYSLSDDWLVGVYGQYDAVGWAVNSDVRDEDVAVTMKSARVGLKVEGRLWNRFWIYGLGGISFARNLEVEEVGGRSLLDEDIDGGGFVQIGINFRY